MFYQSKTLFLTLLLCIAVFCQEVINNDGIIKLVKSGMSEELIVNVIRQQPGIYLFGANELVSLKEAGVSDRLITAMLDKGESGSKSCASGRKACCSAQRYCFRPWAFLQKEQRSFRADYR